MVLNCIQGKGDDSFEALLLNSLLAGACDDDMLCEGDKEVLEGVS
jgi:hypothetical protein